MRQVVRTGKTIDDAVNSCLKVLQVDKDKVQIEVIEEPKTGLFGIIGSKDAIVRVSVKEEKKIFFQVAYLMMAQARVKR